MAYKMVLAYIYKIEHKESGRCYIGHSLNLVRRRWDHWSLLRTNSHHSPYLQNVWNKHGEEAFCFSVMEECDASLKLVREQWWIDNTDSCFNYAKVAGSRKGVPQSEETKEKVRRVHLGAKRSPEARQKMSLRAMGNKKTLGLKWTDEQKKNWKLSTRGQPRTEAEKRHVADLHDTWARSEENIARLKANPPRSMLGRKHSPETKEKMRLARLAVIAAKGPEGMAAIGRKISSTKKRQTELP